MKGELEAAEEVVVALVAEAAAAEAAEAAEAQAAAAQVAEAEQQGRAPATTTAHLRVPMPPHSSAPVEAVAVAAGLASWAWEQQQSARCWPVSAVGRR